VSLPRYFTPRAGGLPHDAATGMVSVLDVFTLEYGGACADWIVGLDADGSVAARRLEPVDALPSSLHGQIAFHEVSGGGRRAIHLDTLFVFEMRLLEQAPDCPGVNDPVFLYGSLIGPLSCDPAARESPRPRHIEGQLTVKRGDLLAGLASGAAWAFRTADANGGRMARTLSLLAGADNIEAIRAGHGAVLIYPLLGVDAELFAMAPGNEDVVSRILYDVLFAWWTDAARDAQPALRDAASLPVPSRAQHEQRLVRDGFEIRQDRAVRPRRGWVGALPGFLGEQRLTLPAEADAAGFIELATEALLSAPEWPSPAVTALNGRVHDQTTWSNLAASPMPARSSSPSSSSSPSASRPLPGWMQGFIADHNQQPPPHLTPGPDDPSAPRAHAPLAADIAARTDAIMRRLEEKFDPPPRK